MIFFQLMPVHAPWLLFFAYLEMLAVLVYAQGETEIKSPFEATKSRLSLGYIGRGYDIYKGNPASENGEVDQGFRLPVIGLPFSSSRFTSDGEYRIPDNVDVISETSASFGSSYHQLITETDYQSMLQVDASVHVEGSGYGYTGSFSASTSYQKTVKEIAKGETTTLDIIGRANVYKARLASTGTQSKLSDFLENSFRALPSENCEEDAIQQMYINVVEQFGTHYSTEVVMGAKAVQELRFKNSDVDRFQSVGISAMVAAELSSPFGASGGFSVGVSSNKELREMVRNTDKEQREYYIGGSPPSGFGDDSTGSTESLREWAKSAADNPAPIKYKLSSIDTLIRPEYFKKTISGLYERRKCLRKALFHYCIKTIAANHCTLLSESNLDGNATTFKYGDFIKVTNGNRFLALSQHFGISPGLTVKPLTTVSEVTNYDGLFQIVPTEGINKFGINLHYGEPFILKTLEGDMLYMGKVMILNTDMPSEARLQDVFTDKDEQRNVNSSHSQITDFSIFLKKVKDCSYLISLKYACHIEENYFFQVQIIGSEGTIRSNVNVRCSCRRGICGFIWFHDIIIEHDIGQFNALRIMGLHGIRTDRIYGVYIKVLINGEKRQVIWNKGHCVGRIFEIGRRSLQITQRGVELDLYPVKFTFHSTDKANLQGQPVKLGDTGFIHILSSMPRKSFWDQGISQLMSVENMGKVGIKEIGPGAHQPISTVCNTLIYPSTSDFTDRYDFSDYIVISFDVNVMVSYVEVEVEHGYDFNKFNFTLAYVNEENEAFTDVSNLKRTVRNNTLNLTLPSSMYTTAIKLYSIHIEDNSNITRVVKMVAVIGCTRAIIDSNTGITNTNNQEWKLKLSENQIQTSPYLKVIPKMSNNINREELFNLLEKPVSGSFSLTIPLAVSQRDCNFTAEALHNFLEQASTVAELKFENVKLTRTSDNSGEELVISMDLTGLNLIEYNRGYMSLNDAVKLAIKRMTCPTNTDQKESPQSQLSQGTSQSSASSTGIIAGFSIIGLLLLVVLMFLICKTYKESSHTKGIKGQFRAPPNVNKGYNEYIMENAGNE
ncbi:uncharacterized protein LOC127704848 [Mytilus californianus]|uniref:uncharacterized protein LOC127704848 n=1 Tax=Mytilus californianus TaxID=6549 RepID=UPI0022472ABF|nr:uncharacterized protein LOC127704848 [Mytilus californianus]